MGLQVNKTLFFFVKSWKSVEIFVYIYKLRGRFHLKNTKQNDTKNWVHIYVEVNSFAEIKQNNFNLKTFNLYSLHSRITRVRLNFKSHCSWEIPHFSFSDQFDL